MTSLPTGLTDGDDDTLASLRCGDEEIPEYDATAGKWTCAGGGGDVTVLTDSSSSLASMGTLSVSLSSATAPAVIQGWVEATDGSWAAVPVSTEIAGSTAVFGDGSDGTYAPGSSAATTLSGTKEYSSFTLPSWQSVTCTGSEPLVIYSTGTLNVDGDINLDGATATSLTGASGVCGGYSGGTGVRSRGPIAGTAGGGPGGGASPNECYDAKVRYGNHATYTRTVGINWWWLTAGNPDPSRLYGGSGGGSICAEITSKRGGGGAGAGAIYLAAPVVKISGDISAKGGGGYSTAGRGSGGGVWIRASRVEISGDINVGDGRLRIDAHEITFSGDYVPGSTNGLPKPLTITRDKSGKVTLKNYSATSKNAVLIAIE